MYFYHNRGGIIFMLRKIFIGSYIIIFSLCILFKFLLNTDVFLIYFIVTSIIVSLFLNICLILKINFICVYIVTIYKSLGYIDNNLSYKTETLQFLGLRDLSSTIILIDILTMPILKYYDLDYVYTTNDILLSIQFIIFVVMIWIEIYSASKIKNKI